VILEKHQPFAALAEAVLAVLPGFAGDWAGATRAILAKLAVSVWAELDARRSLDSAKIAAAVAEPARLLKALDMCRAQER
jgi:hypothetical protein